MTATMPALIWSFHVSSFLPHEPSGIPGFFVDAFQCYTIYRQSHMAVEPTSLMWIIVLDLEYKFHKSGVRTDQIVGCVDRFLLLHLAADGFKVGDAIGDGTYPSELPHLVSGMGL